MSMIIFPFQPFVNYLAAFFTLYTKKQGMFLYRLHNPCFPFSFISETDSIHTALPQRYTVSPHTWSSPRS